MAEEVLRVRFFRRSETPIRRGKEGWVVEGRSFVTRGRESSWDRDRRWSVMVGYFRVKHQWWMPVALNCFGIYKREKRNYLCEIRENIGQIVVSGQRVVFTGNSEVEEVDELVKGQLRWGECGYFGPFQGEKSFEGRRF